MLNKLWRFVSQISGFTWYSTFCACQAGETTKKYRYMTRSLSIIIVTLRSTLILRVNRHQKEYGVLKDHKQN